MIHEMSQRADNNLKNQILLEYFREKEVKLYKDVMRC